MDSLALPDSGGMERRMSQEFRELRQRFVDQEEGGGVQTRIARPKSGTTKLSTTISTNTQGRGAMRKLTFSDLNISSMVGQEATLLANRSANKKRKRGLESETEGTKRCCWIKD